MGGERKKDGLRYQLRENKFQAFGSANAQLRASLKVRGQFQNAVSEQEKTMAEDHQEPCRYSCDCPRWGPEAPKDYL